VHKNKYEKNSLVWCQKPSSTYKAAKLFYWVHIVFFIQYILGRHCFNVRPTAFWFSSVFFIEFTWSRIGRITNSRRYLLSLKSHQSFIRLAYTPGLARHPLHNVHRHTALFLDCFGGTGTETCTISEFVDRERPIHTQMQTATARLRAASWYHIISYHIISRICSAPITKAIGALQKSAKSTDRNTKVIKC